MPKEEENKAKLKEGRDYYVNENRLFVFTREYLLKRGYCCENGCKHCPYGFRK
ncbi:MAG: hypothetical protein KDC58_00590 [Cyclobacteriaceae bacterium]|nr:hypothetical protein [Cyclobacteriaceae bacterium]